MQKPHVAFVSESEATYRLLTGEGCTVVGGAEVQQSLLASSLLKMGYRVTFLVADFGQPAKVVTEQGITLIRTRPPSKGLRGYQYIGDTLSLFRAMNRADADIYYQRTSTAIMGIIALFCRLKRKPFVFSVASNMDLDDTWKRILKPRYHGLYRYGLARAAAVVVQTEDQLRLLRENIHREGVLIRSTYPTPDQAEDGAARESVLWVGSFREVRRPAMFVELAARLPEYRFVMVGGPWETEEYLFDEVSVEAKKVPNLQLTGAVPYDEVGTHFREAKVFVNTSSIEGFPNTYLQAWCRGLPVIATFDADGLISKYGLGRYCSGVDELAHAVRELMSDENLRASIGQRAVEYVTEHHSIESVAERYDELFTRLYRGKA